jgi:hypothetical protein
MWENRQGIKRNGLGEKWVVRVCFFLAITSVPTSTLDLLIMADEITPDGSGDDVEVRIRRFRENREDLTDVCHFFCDSRSRMSSFISVRTETRRRNRN